MWEWGVLVCGNHMRLMIEVWCRLHRCVHVRDVWWVGWE